nr:MAG TPA: ParG [Caudoviricetes sp.]DAG32345.1 MAG TPA: ParG [Caudoviricetes sp.]
MTVSKAQMAATAKYEAKAYDKILVRLPKGQKAAIEAAAAPQGQSVNGFICEAVNKELARREQPET